MGIRQARHFGRARTKFQLYLAATVAKLTLLSDKIGRSGDSDPGYPDPINTADAGVNYNGNPRHNLQWALASLMTASLLVATTPKSAFRPNF